MIGVDGIGQQLIGRRGVGDSYLRATPGEYGAPPVEAAEMLLEAGDAILLEQGGSMLRDGSESPATITALTGLDALHEDDLFAVVDDSAGTTKHITLADLATYIGS